MNDLLLMRIPSISAIIIVMLFSSAILSVFAIDDREPKSYWKLNGNLIDSGSLNVILHNTYPLYVCDVNATRYCFDTMDPLFAKLSYVDTTIGKAVYFNGFTHLTTSFADQAKYEFLELNHPFTLEAWIIPHLLCVGPTCYHNYFISKTYSNSLNNVIGVACGQDGNGALYCYLSNDDYIMFKETLNSVPDDVPIKFDFVWLANGTWNGMLLYINGELAKTKPITFTDSSHWVPPSNSTMVGSIANTEPVVIGNYWIKRINPWVNAYINQVKIYDYARTPDQILKDFQSDIADKTNWDTSVPPSIILTANGDVNGVGLNWNMVANTTSYRLEKNIDDIQWQSLTADPYLFTAYNDYALQQNHTYSYRVSALNNDQEITVSNMVTKSFVQTIPEFGSLVEMIIIISIIGVVTISRRFKFHF